METVDSFEKDKAFETPNLHERSRSASLGNRQSPQYMNRQDNQRTREMAQAQAEPVLTKGGNIQNSGVTIAICIAIVAVILGMLVMM